MWAKHAGELFVLAVVAQGALGVGGHGMSLRVRDRGQRVPLLLGRMLRVRRIPRSERASAWQCWVRWGAARLLAVFVLRCLVVSRFVAYGRCCGVCVSGRLQARAPVVRVVALVVSWRMVTVARL